MRQMAENQTFYGQFSKLVEHLVANEVIAPGVGGEIIDMPVQDLLRESDIIKEASNRKKIIATKAETKAAKSEDDTSIAKDRLHYTGGPVIPKKQISSGIYWCAMLGDNVVRLARVSGTAPFLRIEVCNKSKSSSWVAVDDTELLVFIERL